MWDIDFSQVYLFVIAYCDCTPTGKREDLWDAHVKRPTGFKCLSAYICLLAWCYMLICQECCQVEEIEWRDSSSILFVCPLVKGYSGDLGLL